MALQKYINIWANYSVPKWNGPKDCVTSITFLKAYFKHECSDKGYIEVEKAYNFAETLLEDVKSMTYDKQSVTEFHMEFYIHMKRKKNRWVSMKELYYALPMMESQFLRKYRGRRSFTSVDIMEIWSHYDPLETGYLDYERIMAFAFDLLAEPSEKYKPKVIKLLSDKLLKLANKHDGRISFIDMPKVLPERQNVIIERFPGKNMLTREDFDEVFAQYDQNDNGQISGFELDALIKDISQFAGKKSDLNDIKEMKKHLLHSADVNEDGEINREELKQLMTR